MKIRFLLGLIGLFVLTGFLTGCEDEPEAITGALFSEKDAGSTDIGFNFQLSFDTNRNGIPNWGEVIGLDISIRNTSSLLIRNVSYRIESLSPSNIVIEYDTGVKSLGNIGAGNLASPTTYWCYNCDTASEIRIGHVYVDLGFGSGSTNLNLVFRADYTDSNGRQRTARRTHTITVR